MSESGSPRSMVVPAPSVPAPPVPRLRPAPQVLPERSLNTGLLLLAPALVLSLATTNPSLTVTSVLSLALIIRLLWRPGQPPGLLLVCGLQWLQGSIMTLEANVRGVELWTLSYARSMNTATYLTLGWVTAVAIGAWLVTRKLDTKSVAQTEGLPIAMERLLIWYGGATLGVEALAQVNVQAAAQLNIALGAMRWTPLFAIFAYGWRLPAWRAVVVGVLLFEVAVGFLSFFSAFRVPLYLFAVALVTVGYRPTLRVWAGFAMVFAVTVYLGVLWSAIKMDYRERISGGLGHTSQVVRATVEERAESFIDLVGTVDQRVLATGAERLARRLGYIEYFAYVIDYVPAVRDHERGAIWGAAFTHVLMPRMLFPDKPILPDETAVTERYTGLNLGAGSGTSISIGIPGEAYIDFAETGVLWLGLFFGVLIGLAYRYFVTQKQYGVLAQGMAVALCLAFASVETGAVKSLGALLMLMIVGGIGWRLILPWLVPWLTAPNRHPDERRGARRR